MSTTIDPLDWPDRLNLGCGFDHREGYLNVDLHAFHEPDLVGDVTDLHMLPSGRYRHILAQDLLEHLPRTATSAVLAEWNRLLAPGGKLTLRVPSLLNLVELFQRPENQVPARQELMIQCLFGTQAYTGDFHQTTFTQPILEAQLRAEGFEPTRFDVVHEWLFDVDAEKVGESEYTQKWAPYADLLAQTDVGQFLKGAYQTLLGREPDPAGGFHFKTQLENGGMGYRDVLEALLESEEAYVHRGGKTSDEA